MDIQIPKHGESIARPRDPGKSRYADAGGIGQNQRPERGFQDRIDSWLKVLQVFPHSERHAEGNQARSDTLQQSRQHPDPLQRSLQVLLAPAFMALKGGSWVGQILVGLLHATSGGGKAAVEELMGKILSFFHGYKKERIEEREKREKDDFAKSDLFTRFTVNPAHNSGGQSNDRR